MAPTPRTPLEGVERLVVDGTNLLHQLGRGGAAPPAALVGRLRAAIPPGVHIDIVFDGTDVGPKGRLATGLYIRFAGRRSADDVILEIVAAETRGLGSRDAAGMAAGMAALSAAERAGKVLVVTDDRELRLRLQATGARTARSHWLFARLDLPSLSSPAPGNRRPAGGIGGSKPPGGARGAGGTSNDGADGERKPWAPGRGATAKHGPARKVARHRRHPKMGSG